MNGLRQIVIAVVVLVGVVGFGGTVRAMTRGGGHEMAGVNGAWYGGAGGLPLARPSPEPRLVALRTLGRVR